MTDRLQIPAVWAVKHKSNAGGWLVRLCEYVKPSVLEMKNRYRKARKQTTESFDAVITFASFALRFIAVLNKELQEMKQELIRDCYFAVQDVPSSGHFLQHYKVNVTFMHI